MMTARFLGVALFALGAAAPALAQDTPPVPFVAPDPRSLTVATEIIEIAFPPATRHAMMARTAATMTDQARAAAMAVAGRALDEDARRILDRFIDRVNALSSRQIADGAPALFTAMGRAYARLFSYSELVQIRAFAATPAGAAFMQRSGDVLSDPDFARANTAYMASVMQAMRPLEAQLMEELRVYVETHGRHDADPASGT